MKKLGLVVALGVLSVSLIGCSAKNDADAAAKPSEDGSQKEMLGKNTTPPAYLQVANFKECLASESQGSFTTYCLPETKPSEKCPAESWTKLQELKVPACKK